MNEALLTLRPAFDAAISSVEDYRLRAAFYLYYGMAYSWADAAEQSHVSPRTLQTLRKIYALPH